jgi:hypothetical protein
VKRQESHGFRDQKQQQGGRLRMFAALKEKEVRKRKKYDEADRIKML